HLVLDHRRTRARHLEPQDRLAIRAGLAAIAATPVVTGFLTARPLRLAHRVKLLARAVTPVGMSRFQQLFDHLVITIEALRLLKRPLAPVRSEPAHAVQDGLHGGLRGALALGILNAEHELSIVMTGVQPRKKRRPRTADVEQ